MAVDVLKKTIVEKLPDDLEALEMTMGRLHSMVKQYLNMSTMLW